MGILFKTAIVFSFITLFSTLDGKTSLPASVEVANITNQIDSLVTTYYKANLFSGSVLVADSGKIILHKEYGYTGLDKSQPLGRESVFEIASLSKQFTARLVMILQEEGKLRYDDPITNYFPDLPYQDITIRHLLTHTSGLSEKQFFVWARQHMDPTKIYTNKYILHYLETEQPSLAFPPGEQWEYSNVGYFLLALVIEQTSGTSYIQQLQEKIWTPLDMQYTGIYAQEVKGSSLDNYVKGKVWNAKDSVFVSSFGMAWSDSLYGGVGILSNTTDLLKWDRALYTAAATSKQRLQEAFTPHTLNNGSSSGYGFGWFVTEDVEVNGHNQGTRLNHHGLWPGYESSIVRYIDQQKTIIILANQSPSAKDTLIKEISELLFELK